MKRQWCGLLLLALVLPSCQSSGSKAKPSAPQPLPELLRPYEGSLRVLLRAGDTKALTLRTGQLPTGTCDVAVRVTSLSFTGGTARFALATLGLPRIGDKRRQTCRRLQPAVALTINDLGEQATAQTTERIDAVLVTPEAYLRLGGTAFAHAAAGAPSEVASQLPDASDLERRHARTVAAWPRRLLSIDATWHDPSGRARHERLVAVEAVIGADGRVYRPQVKASIDRAHEAALLAALELWRFEPAHRREGGAIGARVSLESVLRVY